MGFLPEIVFAQPALAKGAPTGNAPISGVPGSSGQPSIEGGDPELSFEQILDDVVGLVLEDKAVGDEVPADDVVTRSGKGVNVEDDVAIVSLLAPGVGHVADRLLLDSEGELAVTIGQGRAGSQHVFAGSLAENAGGGDGAERPIGASTVVVSRVLVDEANHLHDGVHTNGHSTGVRGTGSLVTPPPVQILPQGVTATLSEGDGEHQNVLVGSVGRNANLAGPTISPVPSLPLPVGEGDDVGLRVQTAVATSPDKILTAPVFQNGVLGTLGESAETSATVRRDLATPSVTSPLAGIDEGNDLAVRISTAVAIPLGGEAQASVPATSQRVPSVGEHGIQIPASVRPLVAVPTTGDVSNVRSSVFPAEGMTNGESQIKAMPSPLSVVPVGGVQKPSTDLYVVTVGQAVDTAKNDRAPTTSFAGSQSGPDGQPNPESKPFVPTKPQVGLANLQGADAEFHLASELPGTIRDVKALDATMNQSPARIDPQKTLSVTPIENVQEFRGAAQVNRGPIAPITDMSEGIHRVEQAVRMSQVANQQGIRLQLDPPDLGRLVVNLSVYDQRVTTGIITDHPVARDLLVANQNRLESSLQEQGLRMQEFSVDLGRRGSYMGDDTSQHRGTATRGALTDDAAEATSSTHGEEQTTESDGLNVFA